MSMPRVALCSIWRNDAHRDLAVRVAHLLSKVDDYPDLRWVWAVGDSEDDTAAQLLKLRMDYDVTVVVANSGITGYQPASRLRRLSVTANALWREIDGDDPARAGGQPDDYVLVHESDIVSPPDIVTRLVERAQAGICPVAAWSTLDLAPGLRVFYDTWATRRDGVHFTNNAPYHAAYQPDAPFAVDSFGTVYLFSAADAPRIEMRDGAVLDLCRQLRQAGRTLWMDPTIIVEQPHSLWTPQAFAEVVA